MFFIAWKCTTDTNYFMEEVVIVPVHVRKELQGKVVFDDNNQMELNIGSKGAAKDHPTSKEDY